MWFEPTNGEFISIFSDLTAKETGGLVLLYESIITPDITYKYTLVGFIMVVLGDLGSILGSLIGGIIYYWYMTLCSYIILCKFNHFRYHSSINSSIYS